jgi:predicted dehydrogenase
MTETMKTRIGLVGTGYWGPNLAHSFIAAGGEIAWLCDRDSDRLAKFAERYPEARSTTEVSQLLADPTLDAVAIATPTNTHHPLARDALRAGKHVFVEKPLALCAVDAQELAELSEARGRVLLVGHVFQYNETIRALKAMIDTGELGEVRYLSFTRTNLGPVRTDVNALWDLATHDISIMVYLLGMLPETVTASGRSYLNADIEDVVFAVFGFPNGVAAHVHASWLNPRKVRTITVVGSKKMAEVDDLNLREPIRLYDKRVEMPPPHSLEGSYLEFKTQVVDGGTTVPHVVQNRPLESECAHFLECIRTGRRALSDGRNGLDVVRVLEAATDSLHRQASLTRIK